MKRMSCGHCGHQDFAVAGDDNHNAKRLEVTCLKCKSTTVITIQQPHMVLDWSDEAQGVLCFLSGGDDA